MCDSQGLKDCEILTFSGSGLNSPLVGADC